MDSKLRAKSVLDSHSKFIFQFPAINGFLNFDFSNTSEL